MSPFRLTRFQFLLIALGLLFLLAGTLRIYTGEHVFGVGLWQVALFFGIGTIAAGNVAWIVDHLDEVKVAARHILAAIRGVRAAIDRHGAQMRDNTQEMCELRAEMRELRHVVEHILEVDLQQLQAIRRGGSESGPQCLRGI